MKIGRNNPCPCGSGKKYKKCCLDKMNRGDIIYQNLKTNKQTCIFDKEKRPLPVDNELSSIFSQKDGNVQQEDIGRILNKYNLTEGLILIAGFSYWIYHENKDNFGQSAHREPKTEIIITQFALAYLANIFIISNANNSSAIKLSPNTFLALCNIYLNKLTQPGLIKRIRDKKRPDHEKLMSLMIRMYCEQMGGYQFSIAYLITRNAVLFNEVIKKIKPDKFESLDLIFEKKYKLTISEYLMIGFAFFAGTKTQRVFSLSFLTNAKISKLKKILTKEKIENFLNIISSDFELFKRKDNEMNKNLDKIYTKNRFNPLFLYPLLKTESQNKEKLYLMPNILAYASKVFGGIFWIFHDYFENKGKHLDFRNYFGKVFEEYVGIILKGIYGEENVHPEITYSKNNSKFSDWYIERDNKVYLFEAKAYQFALLSRQTADIDYLIENEIKKIVEAIKQTYKNILDIDRYEELKKFRDKEIIPIIIFYDIPLVSTTIYSGVIKNQLIEIEKKERLSGLSKFNFHLLSIEEFEFFDSVKNKIEIENILEDIKDNHQKGFMSSLAELNNNKKLRNNFLDKKYQEFWSDNFEK